ncbi:ABC transporter ATP-binding protein [Porphyromonas sp.]|uniref:ABC transporter ATP-binding protein n=1 Tax=Porphyromonas sp. TaxID=1924944 RepID=UPI003AB1D62B
MNAKPVISLRNLHKTYQGAQPLHVLKGINLDIFPGEMVAIMGASGSGKSTLLNILGLLDSYDEGSYHLGEELLSNSLSENRAAEIRSRQIGFVFQSFNLIPFKNALDNIALPLFYQGVGRKERTKRAAELLSRMGLSDWAEHLPSEMSGGQKQRIAIARALITTPSVILADEPTGALDSKTTIEVMELLREINRESHLTMIIVTHEPGVAEMCDRTIHIKDGVIEGSGLTSSLPEEVFE